MAQRPRNRKPDPSIVLTITENDIRIFQFLQDHPGADQHLIAEALGYKKTVIAHDDGRKEVRYQYLLKRLTKLRDADYVWWPKLSTEHANHRYRRACYANRPKAEDELRKPKWNVWRPSPGLSNSFAHDYGSAYVPASFRIGIKAHTDLRYLDWLDDLLAHDKCPAVTKKAAEPFAIPVGIDDEGRTITKQHDGRPWGMALLKPDGTERKIWFFLEFHRGTEPNGAGDYKRASAEKHVYHTLKLLADDCAMYRQRFGTRFYVIFACITRNDAEKIKKYILKHTGGVGHPRILITTVKDFMGYEDLPPATGTMLTRSYERAGFAPLDLLEFIGAKEKRAA